MRIINLNPGRDIGASAWFVEMEGHRLLLDAGTHPKREGNESLPLYDLVENESLDAIAISHCHHDHVGSLPVALRYFPKAHVLMTELSYFLVERVLHNSVNVMARQREEIGIKEYPLFKHTEVDEIAYRFQGFKYNREVEWASFDKLRGGAPSPSLEFFDAGHALGSAGIMMRSPRATLFYTGDVSFRDQTLLRGARFDDVRAEVMIMETTRGNREVAPGFSREQEVKRLAEALRSVLDRRGSVLLPVFALGRTQEILALLSLLMRSGQIPRQPVYIGGLGRIFTEIYDLQAHRTHRLHPDMMLNRELELIVLEREKLEKFDVGGGRLFVLTAGMMSENTTAHEVARRMFLDERQAIFFVGYADPDTPGGHLKRSVAGEPFSFGSHWPNAVRHCEVQEFDLTAHANREELLDFVGQVSPRTVVLGHGDDVAREWFANRIQERHPKIKVVQPAPGETIET